MVIFASCHRVGTRQQGEVLKYAQLGKEFSDFKGKWKAVGLQAKH